MTKPTNSEENRIAVVGGGTTGASTAYHLSCKGAKVVLIEKGSIASGTTSLCTSIVRTMYSNEIVARMALHSLRKFKQAGGKTGTGFGFVNSGMLVIASEEQKEVLDSNVRMLRKVGVNNKILGSEDVAKGYPELRVGEGEFFVLEPESGYADAIMTATSYVSMAQEYGTEVITGSEVLSIERDDGRISLQLSNGSAIKCSKTILCTNVWTNAVLESSGVPKEKLIPISVRPETTVVMKRPQVYSGIKSIIFDLPSGISIKPDGEAGLLAGKLDPPSDESYFRPEDCRTDPKYEDSESISKSVALRVPCMEKGEYKTSYIGMYDVTPDQHPIIDELSEIGLPGVYCCVGLSGHGFKLCPALGLMNSEMLLDQDPTLFDREAFSLGRFREGRQFSSNYTKMGTLA